MARGRDHREFGVGHALDSLNGVLKPNKIVIAKDEKHRGRD